MKFFLYNIPFGKAFIISSHNYLHRSGIICSAESDGKTFFSEAAPLLPFTTESVEDVLGFLNKSEGTLIDSIHAEDDLLIKKLTSSPATRFMLDALRLQIRANNHNLPLAKYLNPESADSVSVNATISLIESQSSLQNLSALYDNGFRTFKCKVGKDFNSEYRSLETIRHKYPDIKLRLDANGAWSPDEAIGKLSAFYQLDIEYCEQPVPPEQDAAFPEIEIKSGVPLAADESIRTPQDYKRLISEKLCSHLILKPMFIGCISDLTEIAKNAAEQNISITITSALDSGISRMITAHLAAAYGSKTAHGLATGTLFESDTISDAACINGGKYALPNLSFISEDFNPESHSALTNIL